MDLLVLDVLSNEQEMHVTEVMQTLRQTLLVSCSHRDPPGTAAVLVGSSGAQWDDGPMQRRDRSSDKRRGTCELPHPRVSLSWFLHLSTKEELSQKQVNDMLLLRNTWKESQNGRKKPTRNNYNTDDERYQSSLQCECELEEPIGSLTEASATSQMENTSSGLNSAAQRFTDTFLPLLVLGIMLLECSRMHQERSTIGNSFELLADRSARRKHIQESCIGGKMW